MNLDYLPSLIMSLVVFCILFILFTITPYISESITNIPNDSTNIEDFGFTAIICFMVICAGTAFVLLTIPSQPQRYLLREVYVYDQSNIQPPHLNREEENIEWIEIK